MVFKNNFGRNIDKGLEEKLGMEKFFIVIFRKEIIEIWSKIVGLERKEYK